MPTPIGNHLHPRCHGNSCTIKLAQALDPIFPLRNADTGSVILETATDHIWFAIACRFTPDLIAGLVCTQQLEHVATFAYDGSGADLSLSRANTDNDACGCPEVLYIWEYGMSACIYNGTRELLDLREEALATLGSDSEDHDYEDEDEDSSTTEDTSSDDEPSSDEEEPPRKRVKLYAAMSAGGRAPPRQPAHDTTPGLMAPAPVEQPVLAPVVTRRIASFEELEDGSLREYVDLPGDF
ncbi:hypothetical protein AAF712_010169 [Marasmius tenuissimus]|uniref:Uncharacterized protein n=1 Tax=Marasmius tenuissimus TaxID=585030 RepID=A0ABR2ZNF6_9AGAR